MMEISESRRTSLPGGAIDLTQREHEILALIRQGMTNTMIAEVLFISEDTTKRHVRHILQKFNVNNRYELLCCLLRGQELPAIPDQE